MIYDLLGGAAMLACWFGALEAERKGLRAVAIALALVGAAVLAVAHAARGT